MESHYFEWTQSPWPVDWTAVFGRTAPLRLEIGFGNGEFLERTATREPHVDWVAVEVSWASVKRLLKRLQRSGIDTARVLQGDGIFILEHLFAPGSLDAVTINHPDPWPKKRHFRRRIIQNRTVAMLATRLKPGGTLMVVTDHTEYAEWIEDVLKGQKTLVPRDGRPWMNSIPGRVATKYERQGRQAGASIRYFIWELPQGPSPASASVEETLDPMPNVQLHGSVTGNHILPAFTPGEWSGEHHGEPFRVRLLHCYTREDGAEWWIEAMVSEGAFRQHLMVAVTRPEPDRVLIKPASVGFPRPTPGVKEAVRRAAGMVLGANPGLELVDSSVGRP